MTTWELRDGFMLPVDKSKSEKPKREYRTLELEYEGDREASYKAFTTLMNLHGCRGGLLNDNKNVHEYRSRCIMIIANMFLGDDFDPEIKC